MGSGGSAALGGDLYAMLGWQLLLLLAVVAAVTVAWPARRRGPVAPAGDEPRGRRVLRIGLGVLWIVDGLLQAQPAMPGSFVQQVVEPGLATAPDWLYRVVDPFTVLWLRHPVAADAVTVWVQLGLGAALLVGGAGRVARAVVLASGAWGLFVWAVGEQLGGLTDPAASWLDGAPGAALLYVAASALLLLPASAWRSGVASRLSRATAGAVMLVGAALLLRPSTGLSSPRGLHAALEEVADSGVPGPAAAPVHWLGTVLPGHAAVATVTVAVVVAALGLALLSGRWPAPVSLAAAAVTVAGWWVGQGFGIFGGVGTDPNTGALVLLLLGAGLPRLQAAPSPQYDGKPEPAAVRPRARTSATAGALCMVVVLPLVAASGLLGPVTARAAVGDSGGVVETVPLPQGDFTLTDQNGHSLALRDLLGKVTVVSFLDPECDDSCPLLANQLAQAVRSLGPSASSVALLAVDVNPSFNQVADVAAFTRSHGLAGLLSWHFVTGSTAQVGAVLASFGEGVTVPRVGMIGHPQNLYFLDRTGRRVAVLPDSADAALTGSYVQLIAAELRRHL